MSPLPAHVRAEVRRILDAEARRLLAEQRDADALGTPSVLGDGGALDGGADQRPTGVEGQAIAIVGSVDDDRGLLAA